MTVQDILHNGLKTIRLQAEAIGNLQAYVNEDFANAVELIKASKGRVVVSGVGKSAIVAQKIVGTLNSTGTPALFMHAADAIHGDLGMIQADDVVIIISKSGESPEVKVLAPLVRNFGNKLIGMVGNDQSYLARFADVLLNTTVSQEACPNNLAPTTSTTAQMVMGDALAICLMEMNGFTGQDFAKYHPGGMLGKQLYLRVSDLYPQNEQPRVSRQSLLKDVILSISGGRLGITVVTDEQGRIEGVVTDGDLRRMLEKAFDPSTIKAEDIMTKSPKLIGPDELAVQAMEILKKHDITQLVVTKDGIYVGVIHLHDLIREGLL
jgi:arabinose-5-phosphate isomerase